MHTIDIYGVFNVLNQNGEVVYTGYATEPTPPAPQPTPQPEPTPPPPPIAQPPIGTDSHFVSQLKAAIAEQRVLDWRMGDVEISEPIVLTIDKHMRGWSGLNMNGSKITSRIEDPSKDLLTFEIIKPGIDCRYLTIRNAVFQGSGKERDGIVFSCRTNQSWIYNMLVEKTAANGFGRDGMVWDGSVFESNTIAFFADSNGRNGFNLWNNGPPNDTGILSAVAIWGGAYRKNGGSGIKTSTNIEYREPRNVLVSHAYFVENLGPGINAAAGMDSVMECGFENNGGTGVKFANYLRLVGCRGSSHGPQNTLFEGYITSDMTAINCSVEAYGNNGHTMKLGKTSGKGAVNLLFSGAASGVTCEPGTAVSVIG